MKRVVVLLLIMSSFCLAQTTKPRGILLENLTWQQAEHVLTPDRVVVLLSALRRRNTARIFN